jgi:hypothetical protein
VALIAGHQAFQLNDYLVDFYHRRSNLQAAQAAKNALVTLDSIRAKIESKILRQRGVARER